MNKNMVYGANEATSLTDKVAHITGTNVHFGSGAFAEDKVVAIATAAQSDSKVRFVYDAAGDSGMVFVGNQLASSKILDITTNKVAKKHFDPNTGDYVESTTEKVATKVTVTWFGTQEDPDDHLIVKTKTWTTVFDIIDTDTVKAMIDKASSDLKSSVDDLKAKHEADVLRLDTSVNGIETLLKSDVVSADAGSALTVTPTAADATGYKTYKVAVNVDNDTVKVADNKLKVATYKIAKVADASMEKDGEETKYASEYQLMMTSPDGVTKAVGDKINIAKDFFVKSAHVCTFNYASTDEGTKIADNLIGKDVTAENLPYSKNADGTWEQARIGHGIKYGHSYLHLIINTKTDKKVVADQDVYLDFTEIFTTFKSGDEFIKVENGVVSLNIDAVSKAIDSSLKVNETFTALKAKDAEIEGRLAGLDTSVSTIERSYVTDASLVSPKSADSSQFNTLKITNSKDGHESVVTVDIANQTYYNGLNTALNTLQTNDTYLKELLTWESL